MPSLLASLARAGRVVLTRPFGAIGATALLIAVVVFGCWLPRWNFAFLLIGLAPTLGAIPHLALCLVDRRPVTWRVLAFGFRHYERFVSVVWIGYFVALFLAWPLWIVLWVDRFVPDPTTVRTLHFLGAGTSLAVLAVVLSPYLLVPWLAADAARGVPVATLFDTSRRQTRSLRWPLGMRAVVLVAVAVTGAWTPYRAGLLITVPWALCAAADQFRALGTSNEPSAGASASATRR